MGDRASAKSIPNIELFRDIFNASPVGIAIENFDGQPLFVNPALCSILGFSEDELLDKHCVQFSPPEDAEKDWALFQQLRAGSIDHYQLEKRYFRQDGSLVWGSLSISLLNDRSSPLILAMVQDVTEKKTAEEARYRQTAIIESSEDAIISGTLDGMIVSWNEGARRMYGYTESEAVGKSIAMLVPPELPDEEKQILETLRAGGRIEHFETVRVTKTGKRINVSLTISPIRDSSGRTVGISGIARDITERKRAEERLAATNERLRLAIESGSVGGWDYNLKTGMRVWFGETHAQLGMGDDEPPGSFEKSWGRIHKDDREHLQQTLRVARDKHEQFTEEFRVVWRDGTTHWVRSRGRFFYAANGEPERLLGLSVDITRSKQAEEALQLMNRALEEKTALLKAHEELLRVFVRNVPAAVAMLDRDMRYLQVSDRWCSDNSVEASEILGRSRYEVGPEMPERWKEVNRRALEGETLRAEEDRWESGGKTRWCRWVVRPWKTVDGTVGGILVLTEDITRRKEMEEALSEMSRKLIESQEQERARIARDLHDDIGQRLAMLAVDLDQVQQIWPNLPLEVLSLMLELRQQAKQISTDVQSLSHDLHSSQLEHLGVVAGIKSWCREFGERQRIQIDFEHDVQGTFPPEISLCLFRVLQEALHNAVKHSGVKRVKIALTEDSGEIHLLIRDFGKGFDLEAAKHGSGLGLTSMQERVRLVNGMIEIQSKPMEGTAIDVRVPLPPAPNSQRAAG